MTRAANRSTTRQSTTLIKIPEIMWSHLTWKAFSILIYLKTKPSKKRMSTLKATRITTKAAGLITVRCRRKIFNKTLRSIWTLTSSRKSTINSRTIIMMIMRTLLITSSRWKQFAQTKMIYSYQIIHLRGNLKILIIMKCNNNKFIPTYTMKNLMEGHH